MIWKMIGSVFVIFSCGGFGILTASEHRKETHTLKSLIDCLDFMEWELQYRMTHLPELCRLVSSQCGNILNELFNDLAEQIEMQTEPDVQRCMERILFKRKNIPSYTKTALLHLGRTLGKFDLEGQVKGIISVREECKKNLEVLQNNQAVRIRAYKTLGLCAGAAMAVLLF